MELQLELWLAYLDILSRCNYGHKAGSQAAGKLVALFPLKPTPWQIHLVK